MNKQMTTDVNEGKGSNMLLLGLPVSASLFNVHHHKPQIKQTEVLPLELSFLFLTDVVICLCPEIGFRTFVFPWAWLLFFGLPTSHPRQCFLPQPPL